MRTVRNVLGALTAMVAMGGCDWDAYYETLINNKLSETWSSASTKASLEDQAESELKSRLNDSLDGKVLFSVGWYSVYVYNIDWVTVDMGSKPPTVDVSNSQVWSTSSYDYSSFDWTMTWASGNGAEVEFYVDLRPVFPDHTVRVYGITGSARGTVLIQKPKSGSSQGTATVTINRASVSLSAEAEGWFWTIDISSTVQDAVNDILVEEVAKSQIKTALGF